MVDYKLIHEKREIDGSNYFVTRNVLPVVSGLVKLEGSRAVDNAQFEITGGHGIESDDIITFIADDVPTQNLAFAYNFYFNVRDEGGWNIDGHRIDSSNEPIYGTEGNTSSRFQGHRYLDCTSNTQVIRCKQSQYENNKSKINFDTGREIHLHIRTPALSKWSNSGDTKQIIYSRGMHSGSNAGIEIGLFHDASEDKTYAYLSQKHYNGSSSATTSTSFSSDLEVGNDKDCLIRVRKLPDLSSMGGRYVRTEILVNGKTYGNYVYSSDDSMKLEETNVTKDTYLCADGSSLNHFKGKLYACHGWNNELTDAEGLTVWKRLLPQSTMKFGGRVSDVNNKGGRVFVNAVGFSGILLKTDLDEDYMSSSGSFNDKGIYHFNNTSGTDNNVKTLLENIVQDCVDGYNANKLDTQGINESNGHLGKDVKFQFKFINSVSAGGLYDDEDDASSANGTTGLGQPKEYSTNARNMNRYNIGGRFIDTIRILATLGAKQYRMASGDEVDSSLTLDHLYGADQFQMLPRKVLVFESSEVPNKTYFSTNNGYKIESNGYDDTNIITEVAIMSKPKETIARLQIQNDANGKTYPLTGGGGTSGIYDLEYKMDETNDDRLFLGLEKITIKEVGSDETELSPTSDYFYTDGKIDWDSGLGTNNQTAIYIYVRIIDTGDESQYYTLKNNPVIKKRGLKSRKYIVPQITDLQSLVYLGKRILGAKSEPDEQISLIIPRMTTALHIGMKTTLDHAGKGIYNREYIVKRISMSFPNGKTVVDCGDFAYDVMDDIGMINENVASFQNERTMTH